MFRVSCHGFRNDMYLPSGESCGAAISGLPNSNSRSMMGGNPLEAAFFCSAEARVLSNNARHKMPLHTIFIGNFLSAWTRAIRASEAEGAIVSANAYCCPVIRGDCQIVPEPAWNPLRNPGCLRLTHAAAETRIRLTGRVAPI